MKHILAFFRDHLNLFAIAILLGVAFLFAGKYFAEFIYGALRLFMVSIAAIALRDAWFKGTARPYVESGDFQKDFMANPPITKTWQTIVIIAVIVGAATACFVLP